MSTAIGAIAPIVKVNGSELPAAVLNALIGLRVSSGLRIPSRAVLDFLDDGFTVSAADTFSIGTAVVISASDGTALFTGEVTGVALDIERGAPNLSVTADDAAYKMTLGNKVRTFTQMTYSEVVTKIAAEYGMKASVASSDATHEYLLQSDSDFGLVTEMADRIGYDWWVDGTGTLQFQPVDSDQGSGPSLGWSTGDLRQFSVRASALHPGAVTMNGWDPANKLSIETSSTSAGVAPTASLVEPYLAAADLQSQNGIQSAFRMYSSQADGRGLADSAVARWRSGAATASGVCTVNPAVKPGGRVTIADAGPASGTYPVTEVEHAYTLRGFETRFTAGAREPSSLVDTLAPARVSSFRQDSLVIGVVTNLGDSGSPTGHIKVKYPALGAQIESAWARVVSVGAGKSRGMTFLPEVNDEVIVGFEGGDVSRPLVLGGLYNGSDPALDFGTKDGSIVKRQLVSRLGHVVELGDGSEDADQHIWLTLAGGEHLIKLGKDALKASVPSGLPVTIAAGDTSIEIDKQGNITLSGQKVTIKAVQDVEISGMNVKLKADVAVEGSGTQLKMTGAAQAELSSGGNTSVKGAMVAIN